jgi:hypothetical protein
MVTLRDRRFRTQRAAAPILGSGYEKVAVYASTEPWRVLTEDRRSLE